jgi:cytochrome b561
MAQTRRYTLVAIALHWIIALLIMTNLALGWRMGFLKGLEQFEYIQLHKSIGITVLVLSLARLGWRLVNPPPPLPPMAGWERGLAKAAHWAFYGVMIGMPLTGWAMVSVSAYNIPTLLWQAIPWPHLPVIHDLPMGRRKSIEDVSGTLHMLMAFGAVSLILLHVAAALKHQFVARDGLLGRMIPGLGASSH